MEQINWDNLQYPVLLRYKHGSKGADSSLTVMFESKYTGTVVTSGVNCTVGYRSVHWQNDVSYWRLEYQEMKYDPTQAGDREDDV